MLIKTSPRRSYQRIHYQTRSFHYFHAYAALDRVDLNGLSDQPATGKIDLNTVIPSETDLTILKESFKVFVNRWVQ